MGGLYDISFVSMLITLGVIICKLDLNSPPHVKVVMVRIFHFDQIFLLGHYIGQFF